MGWGQFSFFRSFVSVLVFFVIAFLPCEGRSDFSNGESQNISISVGYFPENIQQPIDVAAYLAWVRTHIPELHANTRDYAVDFWKVVHEQGQLQQLFSSFSLYREYLKDKQELLHFRIVSARIEPPAYDVRAFRAEASETAGLFPRSEDLRKEITKQITLLGNGSSRGLLNDLMTLVDKNDRDHQNASIDSILEYFLSRGFPEKFRAEKYGLIPFCSPGQIKERFLFLQAGEEQVARLRRAKFYLDNKDVFERGDESDGLSLMEKVPKGDIKTAISGFRNEIRNDITKDEAATLELREEPVAIAIWKNCLGIECTPARFAFAPSERAFFVYDLKKPDEPKGYIGMALVNDDAGRRVLLVKGVQGAQISPSHVESVLMKAPEIAVAMGAERAVLVRNAITNYSDLSHVFYRFHDRDSSVKIVFPDEEVRSLLDIEPKDAGGVHHSESMNRISDVLELNIPEPEKALSIKLEVIHVPIEKLKLPPPSDLDRFEAGVAFARYMGGRSPGEITYVLYNLGLVRGEMESFVSLINKPGDYTMEEFKSEMVARAKTKQGPLDPREVLSRLDYFVDANLMRFKNSFDEQNENKSVGLLVSTVRKLKRQEMKKFQNFIDIEGRPVPVLKERIRSLIAKADSAEDIKVAYILFTMLKSAHLTDEYSLSLVDVLSQRTLALLSGSDFTDQQKSDFLKNSGYYDFAAALYPLQIEAVSELIRSAEIPWALVYYVEFAPEIRDRFPAFRLAALRSLQRTAQNYWWLTHWKHPSTVSELLDFILERDPSVFETFSEEGKKVFLKRINDGSEKNAGPGFRNFRELYNRASCDEILLQAFHHLLMVK